MSYDNPYDSKPQSGGNSGGFKGGNNFRGGGGGRFPQQEPKTPEQLARMRLPVSVVITGADNIPDADALTLDRFCKIVDKKRVTIRSGGTNEADMVVTNAVKYVEQHTPWKGFAPKNAEAVEVKGAGSTFNTDECFEFAKRFFIGDFESIHKVQRAIYGRNARLLFGKNLKNPTQLLIIWTPEGEETASVTNSRSGIVGHLIRLAQAAGIPVINIKNPNAEARLNSFLENINVQQPFQSQQAEPSSGYSGDSRSSQGTSQSGFNGPSDDDIPY